MNQWTPDAITRLIVELGTLVAAIAGLWKSITAHAKADANTSSIEAVDKLYQTNAAMASQATAAVAAHVGVLSDRVHDLAVMTPPPAPDTQTTTTTTPVTGKPLFVEVATNHAAENGTK